MIFGRVLLVLVTGSLACLSNKRVSHFDVDKERSIGLDNLFEQLQKRSQSLSWGDISKAMTWMVRAERLDLAKELIEGKGDSSCLLWNRSLKTILRYFPPNIRKEIMHDIVIEKKSHDERPTLAIISNALKNKYHLVQGRDVYMGAFAALPQEILKAIIESLNPNELMHMMVCSWDIHDVVAEFARTKCHRFDEQDRVWTPCLRKIHHHWITTADEEDKQATELILCGNHQVSLLMDTIILGLPFKSSQWQRYYRGLVEKIPKEDSEKRSFPYWHDSFDEWVKEFAPNIQPSVLELLIESDHSIEITWRTIKHAIEGKMRASAVLVLMNNVSENRTMCRSLVSTAVKNYYDCRVILPCIKAHLLVFKKLYKEELEMAVKICRHSEDLTEILDMSEPNYTTEPTHRTVNRLLDEKFSEACCILFFEKYPHTKVGQEHAEIINNRQMSPEFFARLLLSNDQMRVSGSMMEKLPGEVSEDLYLLFLSRTNVPLVPQKVVEAMQRKFGEPTIRFMLRSCFGSIRVHHIESLKQAAVENGYSQDLLDFIPSLHGFHA